MPTILGATTTLERLRTGRGLSQREMGFRPYSLDRATICRLERRPRPIAAPVALRLAVGLSSPEDFVGDVLELAASLEAAFRKEAGS